MTAAAFERLLYTDCRAGQGRGGGAGFQIQAQSAGVTASLSGLAVNTLLYVAPTEWIASRAVEDFPLGLAHAAGEGWGTAQSRYLGREVTGSRSGNHLADCLLTTDREPYGAIRPAQLLEAKVWRDAPFEATECPPFDDFLEPGPLTNDEIQAWLREDEGRAQVLGRLVTVLEDPQGSQVVIAAATTEQAVRWIAAATMLLPIEEALDVSFKVFVTDLNRSPQRIIGAPKELNPTLTPESLGRRFLVDATTGVSSGGETSERAAYWVGHLAEADDPYDIVGAVDFAHLLAGGRGDTPESRETAWLITDESGPVTEPEPAVRWLRTPKDPELGEHESAAAKRLIGSGLLDSATLAWMEQMADADRLYVDRAELRRALLTAEIDEVGVTTAAWPGDLTRVDIGDGPRRDAESAISSALLLAADDAVVDRLLQVARRHEVPLAVSPLRDRLSAFVGDWIANPSLRYDPGKWALSEFIVEELARQLTGAEAPGLARARPLLEQTWPYLLRQVADPAEPLIWELLAASVANSAEGAKERELKRATGLLAAAADPRQALAGFQGALVRWRALSRREAVAFVTMAPADVPLRPELAEEAAIEIRRRAAEPDALLLDAIWRLEDRRLLPFSEATEEISRTDRTIAAFRNTMPQLRSSDELKQLPDLKRMNQKVIRVRAPGLLDASLEDGTMPLLGAFVLSYLPESGAKPFLDAWSRRLGGERGAMAAARGYLWSESSAAKLPDARRREIADGLRKHAESLREAEKAAWTGSVEALLGPEAADFGALLSGAKRRSRLNMGRSKHD